MSARHSLTVILPTRDADACRAELDRQRPALEGGWAEIHGLLSASLTLLPGDGGSESALLLECSFDVEFAAFARESFARLGQELSAVLAHCAAYPEPADARTFADYLSSRAQRSFAFAESPSPRDELDLWRSVRRWIDALNAPKNISAANEQALEARRLAVGMQEPRPGVPLVHVAWLQPASRARVLRALRDLPLVPGLAPHDARFLVDRERLVLVAYPSENAQRWSERLSRVALEACARVWRNCAGFPRLFGARRARRERRLAEFVLEHRIPVAAWFNARAPLRGARRQS